MIADPVPDNSIFLHDSQSAVLKADASRVDVIRAFQFLELQTGMRWVALDWVALGETIGGLRVPLNVEE